MLQQTNQKYKLNMKKLSRLIVYVALALVPMLLSRCTLTEDLGKLKTSLDSVKIAIGTPEFNTLAHLKFVDAATNLPIEDQDVKVTLSGKDAALMYNNMGAHMTEYTGKWGLLDLVIDPHKVDSSALRTNPIEFVITPTMTGYVGDPQLVLISNPTTNIIIVPMINLSAPPAGYYNSMNVIVGNTNSNGQIGGGTTINLAPRRISKSNLVLGSWEGTIGFLSGTTLLDVSGNILIGSVSYDFTSNGNYNSWPIDIPIGGNAYKRITKYFDFSLQLYVTPVGGVKTPVASFGNNGGVILAKVTNYINRLNGTLFKEGDKIDRWQTTSLLDGSNVNSTLDVIKQVYTIGGDGPGVLDTLKNVSNLKSTWGSFQYLNPVNVILNINGVVTRPNTFVTGTIEKDGLMNIAIDGTLYKGRGEILSWLNLDFYNPTGSKQLNFTYWTTDNRPDNFLFSPYYGLTFFPTNISYTPNFTEQSQTFTQNITVAEDIAGITDLVTANIDLTVVSQSNPSIEIKPNVNIEVGASGSMQSYKLKNGSVKLSLKLSQPYIVHGQFGTSSGVGTLTVSQVDNNYVAKFRLTMGSTPGQEITFTIPKTADKTIDINYKIPVADDVFNQFKNQ